MTVQIYIYIFNRFFYLCSSSPDCVELPQEGDDCSIVVGSNAHEPEAAIAPEAAVVSAARV